MTTTLRLANLPAIAENVAVPSYDRRALSAGIVHFGVGNFHRGHQAVYLDRLLGSGVDRDWAIIGAGVRPTDGVMRDKLQAQDWLTTVVEQEADSSSARITGAMIDHLPIGDTAAIVATLMGPAIRIVSLTITEGGYYIDPATQRFDPTHVDILEDADQPQSPRTVFGLIIAGLSARRRAGIEPFTVMSCDNIPGNGHVTRNAVVGLARLSDPELAEWISKNVAFPNSMVDRITPATTDRERNILADEYNIADSWPVFCESYIQWVVEDHFPAGRPALETVGVQFVTDVEPFELMKIRVLNGGHATIAYPAALLDIHFVHEAMEDPLIRGFLNKVESEEIIPIVPPVPGINLSAYYRIVVRRFANPKIGDTVNRLCFDGPNRQPKFILPTAADRLKSGYSVTGLALVSALWARYCYGITESGKTIAPNDPNWDRLTARARLAKDEPGSWLDMRDVFGDVATYPDYVVAFTTALSSLWARGTRATLELYLADHL
ncbi:MAG: mannitol dehydrogenase family protein [Devosia sp.]|nr:mannitol dehydrogenase family protein [Devosia sp.]